MLNKVRQESFYNRVTRQLLISGETGENDKKKDWSF